MFDAHRRQQFASYNDARVTFVREFERLIALERFFADYLVEVLRKNYGAIAADYDEASFLYPFWQNYPPDERGRQPVGDQFPWIEVGEHSIGSKLPRLLEADFKIRDSGLPTGADKRFVLSSPRIKEICGITDTAWLFVDIKSVGPRDNFPHTVMSHNQVSGDGIWEQEEAGVRNSVLRAVGPRASHDFHCSIPPVYVLQDGTIAPSVLMVIKPVYSMLSLGQGKALRGQPLESLTVVTIPNGILLTVAPDYLKKHPRLLFPGKDDKEKNPLKVRARISFELLRQIAGWRVATVRATQPNKSG